MILVSLAHCQLEPISVCTACHVLHGLGQLLELISRFDRGIGSIFHRLHILCSLGILVQQRVVLSADAAACGRRTRNVGNGLIQKFPHIYLSILIRTEANIVHQIVHVHLDIAVLHLLEIIPDISGIRKSAGQHWIKITICRGTIIIMINTVLIILTNAGEICRVQSGSVYCGCRSIICIGRRGIHHRQVFFPNGRRVAELNLFSRLQNKVCIRSILIAQAQFIYGKGNLICGIFIWFQIRKCLLCCIIGFKAIGIGHLSAVVIAIYTFRLVCQIQCNVAQILFTAVRIQKTQVEIGYAVADPIRIVQSLGKIFRYLIIDHRVNKSALLTCLFSAAQCGQVIFQCYLLPNSIARTIACFLCILFVIRRRSIALGRECLGVERGNGIFPVNTGIQNCAVCQLHCMFCCCCHRCHTAAALAYCYCIFVFAVDMLIGIRCREILLIGVCLHASAVCHILISADTSQRYILERHLRF